MSRGLLHSALAARHDLARFADALLSHKLLSPDSTKLLITGKVQAPGARYAYGFEDARDAHGNGWVGHGGGAPGNERRPEHLPQGRLRGRSTGEPRPAGSPANLGVPRHPPSDKSIARRVSRADRTRTWLPAGIVTARLFGTAHGGLRPNGRATRSARRRAWRHVGPWLSHRSGGGRGRAPPPAALEPADRAATRT
jgi:hypothetical protein